MFRVLCSAASVTPAGAASVTPAGAASVTPAGAASVTPAGAASVTPGRAAAQLARWAVRGIGGARLGRERPGRYRMWFVPRGNSGVFIFSGWSDRTAQCSGRFALRVQ